MPHLRTLITIAVLTLSAVIGCGTTQQRSGTEQLLLSDSVDRAVDKMNFAALANRKVYLDASYIEAVKGIMFVNADYIVSAIRHKMTVSGCLVQRNREDADYVVEARVGALGTDAMEVTYGIPASNALSAAATLVTSTPALPTIPEISVGKRNATLSTSKIVAYAYHRESGTPVWQSGSAIAKTDAKHTWVMGAGPLQRGTIYKEPTFAGISLKRFNLLGRRKPHMASAPNAPLTLADAHQFVHPAVLEQQIAEAKAATDAASESGVVPASHETEVPANQSNRPRLMDGSGRPVAH